MRTRIANAVVNCLLTVLVSATVVAAIIEYL